MEAKTAGTERTERLEVRLTPAESAALAAAAAREGLATATWARRALRLAAGLLVAGVAGCAHAPRSIHTPTATDGAVLLAEGREVRADLERRIRDMQREPAAFDGVKRGGGW